MQKLSGKACTGVQGLSPYLSAHVLSEIFLRAFKVSRKNPFSLIYAFIHSYVMARMNPCFVYVRTRWMTCTKNLNSHQSHHALVQSRSAWEWLRLLKIWRTKSKQFFCHWRWRTSKTLCYTLLGLVMHMNNVVFIFYEVRMTHSKYRFVFFFFLVRIVIIQFGLTAWVA